MNWDNIKHFIATARAGSLTIAAKSMDTSPATLSRRLESLEQDCGVTLFTRTHTGYSLTRDGESFLSRCLAIEDAVLTLERSLPISDPRLAGVVRIATSENLANLVILPPLQRLRATYPMIEVELQTGAQPIPLRGREVDVAVRMSIPSAGNFKARAVGHQAHALYVARAAAEAPANAVSEEDGLRIIGWPDDYTNLPLPMAASQHPRWREPRLRVDTLQGHVAAARAGLGLAYLPCFVGDAVPDLTRVDGPQGLLMQKIYLVLHNDSVETRRVRVVADFIIETLHAAAPLLEGTRIA